VIVVISQVLHKGFETFIRQLKAITLQIPDVVFHSSIERWTSYRDQSAFNRRGEKTLNWK